MRQGSDKEATAGRNCQNRSSPLTPDAALKFHPALNTCSTTYLGGEGILCSGVFLLILKLLSLLALCATGLFDATDASVDRAGS
jgi:hypothetical protein